MTDDIEFCKTVLRKLYGSDLDKYVINVEGTGTKGDGYTNEMIFLNLINGEENINLVIKMMPHIYQKYMEDILPTVYKTEITFYADVWPILDKFQKDNITHQLFDKIPRYFGSACYNGRSVLVLENLRVLNFALREKKRMYDKQLVELMFKNFAKFHAISLALKYKNPSEFQRLRSLLTQTSNDTAKWDIFRKPLSKICRHAASQLTGDEEISDIMNIIAERVLDEFEEVALYKGNNHTVVHGDCWINNFMFKNNESGELEDVRLLDFQVTQVGTPVYDLSTFFYSGATKDILDDLEYYLKVYHGSLSNRLREFGCDPEELYSYETFKVEWKGYCKFGFIMSFMVWREKTRDSTTYVAVDGKIQSIADDPKCDEAKYAEVIGDLVRHMVRNNFL